RTFLYHELRKRGELWGATTALAAVQPSDLDARLRSGGAPKHLLHLPPRISPPPPSSGSPSQSPSSSGDVDVEGEGAVVDVEGEGAVADTGIIVEEQR